MGNLYVVCFVYSHGRRDTGARKVDICHSGACVLHGTELGPLFGFILLCV